MPVSLRPGQTTTEDDMQARCHRRVAKRPCRSDIRYRFQKHNQQTQNQERRRPVTVAVKRTNRILLRSVRVRKLGSSVFGPAPAVEPDQQSVPAPYCYFGPVLEPAAKRYCQALSSCQYPEKLTLFVGSG